MQEDDQKWRRLQDVQMRGAYWLRFALDRLLPPRCFSCGQGVADQGQLCAPCWQGLNFITDPQCLRCGLPFEYHMQGVSLCGACLGNPPVFDQARMALHYDDASRPLILAFKHGDQTRHARSFAQWMTRVARPMVEADTLILPVPLHRRKLVRRRYNQAALLAKGLAHELVLQCDTGLLQRVKATPSQGGLNAHKRYENVRGAFALSPERGKDIENRPVLLVDDVYTTGATVSACAKVLRKGGARSVSIVTLARVVRPVNPAI